MSLVRAFTTRRTNRGKPEVSVNTAPFLGRAASQRAGKPVLRALISAPVALVSTSNATLNNAQPIAGTTHVDFGTPSPVLESSASSTSGEDSDAGSGGDSFVSCESSTDASSVDSPTRTEPEPNHLSCYFNPAVDTHTKSTSASPGIAQRPSLDTPKLPQRVPSHSKKAHESLHRQRSIRRMMSPPPTNVETASGSDASPFVEAPIEGPFGSELAQLDEVAEELGHVVRDVEASQDALVIESRGLAVFSASEYLAEIQSLIYADLADDESVCDEWI